MADPLTKERVLEEFELFSLGTGGIGSWITESTAEVIFERLSRIESDPLTKVQFNQLRVLGHEAPSSDGFFRYYWLTAPTQHTYDCTSLPEFDSNWLNGEPTIKNLLHLKWGFYRLFIDGLLYFGNVRSAYRTLREMSESSLATFFGDRRYDTDSIKARGPALRLRQIAKDKRYLISEMACKSYGETATGDLKNALFNALEIHLEKKGGPISIGELISGTTHSKNFEGRQQEFEFSADEVLNEKVSTREELERQYQRIAGEFIESREAALENTRLFLSMVSELDVYVATSMRNRQDFRQMADACEQIFTNEKIRPLRLRYFDPTMSAARGHEDKGLIECLMVKCAKALIYCAGDKESWGKDAEAAMALSLGKPVIFLCDHETKQRFFRDVHPLSRLIHFETGVAVGAIVTDSVAQVSELLFRLFENRMEYRLEHSKKGFLRLKEKLTDSVVRLQTSDTLISETFWNHYRAGKQM